MGYACPVCEAPQADGAHLANHLAFTGLLHDDEHADWLDTVVPGWADRSPEELAGVVVDHAESIDVETVTAEVGERPRAPDRPRVSTDDPAVQRAVDEAIEMTKERLAEESEKD